MLDVDDCGWLVSHLFAMLSSGELDSTLGVRFAISLFRYCFSGICSLRFAISLLVCTPPNGCSIFRCCGREVLFLIGRKILPTKYLRKQKVSRFADKSTKLKKLPTASEARGAGADTGGCTSCTEDRRIFRSKFLQLVFQFS